jgi:endonuclease/exonuclease/phosphatase family metal-dependent hydrolase
MQLDSPGAHQKGSPPMLHVRKATLGLFLLPFAVCASERTLSVVTLNLAKEPSAAKMAAEITSVPALRDADVFLLQEVEPRSAAVDLAARLRLHAVGSKEAIEVPNLGLAILSRYPLRDVHVRSLRKYNLVYRSRSRFALTATADTPWGPVRIVNTHLDTRVNAADRLAQLDDAVRNTDRGATIVGGDFNSNWFYWIQHVLPLPARSQSRSVEAFMTRAGYSSAIPSSATTFDWLGQHLDWIWVRGLKSTASRVFPLKFSDHHACWTRVEL